MVARSGSHFIGGYAVERAIWDSDLGGVYEARAPLSDSCGHVVKIRRGAPDEGEARVERGLASLLESAEAQASAFERAPAVWAEVVESGRSERGAAYVVRPRFACSLADLTQLRARLGSEALASVIEPVLAALVGLREACGGRAHGALRPENVLLEAPTGGRRWRAVLTDPLPASLLDEGAASRDLRAVGSMIERLATGRPPGRGVEADWSGLGRAGRAWRELSGELRAEDEGEQPTLDGALKRVRGIVARRARARRNAVGGAVGVGVLAVAGAGSLWYLSQGEDGLAKGGTARAPFEADSFRRWCADADTWILYLEREGASRRAELSADAHIANQLLPVLDEAAAREIELDPKAFVRASPRSRLRLIDFLEEDERNRRLGGRTTEAMDIIGRLRAAIARWDSMDEARSRAVAYRERGWGPQATALARLAAEVTPPVWVDPASGLLVIPEEIDAEFGPRMTPAMLELIEADAICDDVEGRWKRIELLGFPIETAAIEDESNSDPVLERFPELAPAYVAFSGLGGGIDSLQQLDQRVTRVDELAQALHDFCTTGWENVDREFFAATSETLASYDPEQRLTPVLFERWLAEASAPGVVKLDPADDPRLVYGGRAGFEALVERFGALRSRYGAGLLSETIDAAGVETRLGELVAAAGEADETGWKRLTQQRVEEDAQALRREHETVASLLESASSEMAGVAAAYERSIRASETVSADGVGPLDEAWREARDALLARYDGDGRYADLVAGVDAARQRLVSIESALRVEVGLDTAPRGLDVSAFGSVARARLVERAGAVLDEMTWSDGSFTDTGEAAATLERLAGEQREWGRRVRELVSAHATIEALLDAAYGLDEAGAAGESARNAFARVEPIATTIEAEVVGALSSVRDRVRALESLEQETDPAALARAGADAEIGMVSLRVGAYEGAGRAGGASWATSPGQLREDLAALSAALESVSTIEDPDRLGEVRDRVRDAGRARWTRFAAGADSTALLDEALAVMDAYAGSVDDLTGAARYNLRLREFESGVDLSMEEDALRVRVARLRDQLAPAVAAMDPGSDAARFAAEVAQVAEPPNSDEPPLDAQDFGPGAHGWDGYDIEAGERLVYSFPTRANPQHVLEFVRVEPTSDNGLGRPAYIATQETSLGIVIHAGERMGDWDALVEVWSNLGDARSRATRPGGQEWAGPRAWRWVPGRGAVADTMGVGESWLKRHSQIVLPGSPAYPEGLGDPNDALLIARSQGRPSASSPAQDVSFAASGLIAEALGCRLPREDEWAAAFRFGVGAVDESAWNLRDATFARQRDWVRSVERRLLDEGQTSQFQYPDRDSFLDDYEGGQGADAQALATDDGVLWFEPVGGGRGEVFESMIGNVAEFVTTADGFGVVGGSALSPPGMDPTMVRPVKSYRRLRSYTDIGFRLALDVPDGVFRQTVNRRVERLLARAPYVFE